MVSIRKIGSTVSISWELWYSEVAEYDDRYARKEKSRTVTPPSDEDWHEYYQAKEALDFLERYEGFDGGYDGYYLSEPQPRVEIEFAETVEEWLKRCRKLDGRDG